MEHVVAGAKTRRLARAPRYIGGELCVTAEFVERALPQILDTQAHLQAVQPSPIPAPPTFAAQVTVLKKVVVDAGHGGHDAGATSPEGIKEKDINLGVALKLRELLERNTQIDVVLTRDGDYFIPLAGRTQMGNRS
ncbi:MAG: N-acetylmuramoyl-L-alanine amidase, partial [Deltaproteobacteria bacterium]|nr:N-acetylmuramoyl-L-alanine amidase [Deltaproteobacteria bacterium]